jgi:hypothetical protein
MIKKILLIEDGSVFLKDEVLVKKLEEQNIYILVYRQGANKPELIDLDGGVDGCRSAIGRYNKEIDKEE